MKFIRQKSVLLAILVIAYSCEKESSSGIEFSSATRLEIRDLNIMQNTGVIFYDTLIASKIYLDQEVTTGYNKIDEDGNVQLLRPVFDKYALADGDVEIDYIIPSGQDILELKLNKSADRFDINLFFNWEVKKGESWELVEDLVTVNQVHFYNYSKEIINSFIDEISIKNLDTISVFSIPSIRFKYRMNKK